MAVAGAPWQLECENMEQRCGYLLSSGLWSDCTFVVGAETNQVMLPAHKLVLAMASPVFEAMFFGGLSESIDPIVPVPDVGPEAFRSLLLYIYTGNISISSFDVAWDLWYGAKKYMLPQVEKECYKYVCSNLSPRNACSAYESARLFDEKTLMDKCIQVICSNTKEVINDSSFENIQINTMITVCTLDHLTIDSDLDLFYAVARYAEAEHRRQEQISPPAGGAPPLEALSQKVLLRSDESSSQNSPAAELTSKPPAEVTPSEPTADKDLKAEESSSVQHALQRIRFLSLSAEQFAEGPARSGLLTKDEILALFMNISCRDSPVPMPTGFSECRERRQPRTPAWEQRYEPGSWDYIISALQCGTPSQVQDAALAACILLKSPSDIQPALDKGILEALVPALTEGDNLCKDNAALAICNLCVHGSPSQRDVLAASAALQPYCRLLDTQWGNTRTLVLQGLTYLLKKAEQQHTKDDLLLKLRDIDVPRLLRTVLEDGYERDREDARKLLQTYFECAQVNTGSSVIGSPLQVACSDNITNRKEIIKILLESGANPNLKVYNDEDMTQLRPALAEYLASNSAPQAEVVSLLLRYGARVIMKTQFRDPDGILNHLQNVTSEEHDHIFYLLLEAAESFDLCMIKRNNVLTPAQKQTLIQRAKTPIPLIAQSRIFLRRFLGPSLVQEIYDFDIPKILHQYLIFECR